MLILPEGAFLPITEAGTILGTANAPAAATEEFLMNSLRVLAHGARVVGLAITAALPFAVVLGGLSVAAWYVVRRLRRRHAQQPSLPA